jgi:hypothetical protein
MIEITNGNIVDIKPSIDNEYQCIVLNKALKLKSREKFFFNTGITINCTSDLDECWIYSDPIFDKKGEEVSASNNIGILTQRITKSDGPKEIELTGGYVGEGDVTLYKGTEIARIYTSISNTENLNADELKYHYGYQSDKVVVKFSPEHLGMLETVSEPSGATYIKVYLS